MALWPPRPIRFPPSLTEYLLYRTLFKPTEFTKRSYETKAACTDRLLTGLEDFWDSEVPRIGEDISIGWAAWYAAGISFAATADPIPDMPETTKVSDLYTRWYDAERLAEARGARPTRISKVLVGSEEDSYSAVVFGDISDFLLPITSESAKLQLIYAVLLFLGLPFTPAEANTNAAFISDPQLMGERGTEGFWPVKGDQCKEIEGVDADLWTSESPGEMAAPTECPVKCWAQGEEDTLFPGTSRDWFALLRDEDVKGLDVEFCR